MEANESLKEKFGSESGTEVKKQEWLDSDLSDFAGARVKNNTPTEVRQKKSGSGASFELKKKRRFLKKNQSQNSTLSDEESPLGANESLKEISEERKRTAKKVSVSFMNSWFWAHKESSKEKSNSSATTFA